MFNKQSSDVLIDSNQDSQYSLTDNTIRQKIEVALGIQSINLLIMVEH